MVKGPHGKNGMKRKRKADSRVTGAANAPQHELLERARREMHLKARLRFRGGGRCADTGVITASIWDHWQIIPRQYRQRYYTAPWTYFWFPTETVLECREKDFRFTTKQPLDRHFERRILDDYCSRPLTSRGLAAATRSKVNGNCHK